MLKFKEGVELTISQAINKILYAIVPVFDAFQEDCIITSGRDGTHMKGSKHETNEALDLRIFHLKPDHLQPIIQGCQHALGKDYDVVLEGRAIGVGTGPHLHIEYDPFFER